MNTDSSPNQNSEIIIALSLYLTEQGITHRRRLHYLTIHTKAYQIDIAITNNIELYHSCRCPQTNKTAYYPWEETQQSRGRFAHHAIFSLSDPDSFDQVVNKIKSIEQS